MPIFMQLENRPLSRWSEAELAALYEAALGKMNAQLEEAEKKVSLIDL